MLHSIPTDIVELIILKSFDYGVFQKLQEFLIKLNEPSRVSRINDKLTVTISKKHVIEYKLNGLFHREYDKPDYITRNIHTWSLHGVETRLNNPSTCWTDGSRNWLTVGMSNKTDDSPSFIYDNGKHTWNKDRKLAPSYITIEGDRYKNNNIFDYLH